MGIYDREYYRDETERDRQGGSWSAVGTIIVLNIAVFLTMHLMPKGQGGFATLEQFSQRLTDGGLLSADEVRTFVEGLPASQRPADGQQLARALVKANILTAYQAQEVYQGPGTFIERWFTLRADLLMPDQALELFTEGRIVTLVTYGFAHSLGNPLHIIFNMLMLWMFGSDIECIYGKRLFWKMYLSFVVLSGLCWVLVEMFFLRRYWPVGLFGGEIPPHAVGASGAVAGVMMLYVLHFPHRTILFFGVLPIPVWLWGMIWLGQEYLNFQLQVRGEFVQIAHAAHLGGALAGWMFYRTHFTLFSLLPTHWLSKLRRSPRSRMRVVHPDETPEEESLEAEVDRILAKISQQGTESLTQAEIRTLEAASRRAQRRRGGARLD